MCEHLDLRFPRVDDRGPRRGEDRRLRSAFGARRRDPRAPGNLQRLLPRPRPREAQLRGRGRGWPQLDAEQFEELDVRLVRNPVHPVGQDVGQIRKRLQQHDAGIARGHVGPGRTRLNEPPPRVFEQLRETTIVKVGRCQWHRVTLPTD